MTTSQMTMPIHASREGKVMHKELHKFDTDELDLLLTSIENDAHRTAARLFPDRPPGHKVVLDNISQWAINRKVVLDCKAKGNAHVAIVFDKICYRIWQQLPGYAQSLKLETDPEFWMVS